ncbi:SufD family Fe-S cluster assembly protein [Promethearchaeum syntrophicum]|uniref:SufD family Fe-S cluster assembly protein n=1 Tax=Promethearchaeum syntrophicum TaxID=2594042 RepID=A0A5B9D7Q5_9ARCH|nr:SufD family Fe-S cluster assembly protein [Candidatus Prometheoarchaeum syntrophicum]QEE15063.1 cysteine desulfurase activator complex subunit SufB [Candidatus Prometheoarchaeum syntrophicum]
MIKKKKDNKDIDLNEYKIENLETNQTYDSEQEIPVELKESMKKVGIEVDSDKSGIFLQSGNKPDLCVSKVQGIELMPLKEALKKFDGSNGKLNLQNYFWKAVASDKDKFTAEAAINEITDGYFIHALAGKKTVFPLQSCLFIPPLPGLKQVVHNIIIAEPGSQLDIITGCTAHTGAKSAIHLGVSEFYVKKDAKVSFTMVHNWTESTKVRPRTGIVLEENAKFSNFYVVMSEVKNLQTNPVIKLIGKNASYFGQTLIYAKGESYYDTGATAHLIGEGSKAEIISRVLAVDNSHVIARGKIIGDGKNVTGHIDCSALLLSPNARVDSIPEINAQNPEVSLTHEASVGKISDDHIEYLMSRGLTEDEAINLIVSGFLDVDTSPLPPSLAEETKKIIDIVSRSEMG